VLKYRVPHGSQPRPGWAPDPLMVGIRSPDGLVVGLAPATLEFWVRFPNERNQGKQAHPVLKYRVPQGSHPPRSLVRDEQTHPHRPRLVVSNSTCPPLSSSPHANSFVIGPAVIKHTHLDKIPLMLCGCKREEEEEEEEEEDEEEEDLFIFKDL
jgi:hypothetical protein